MILAGDQCSVRVPLVVVSQVLVLWIPVELVYRVVADCWRLEFVEVLPVHLVDLMLHAKQLSRPANLARMVNEGLGLVS